MRNQQISVSQGDDVTVTTEIIKNDDGTVYDATGHTTELLVKADAYADDTTATTYAGTLTGDASAGFRASYSIPRSALSTPGTSWYRARVVTAGNLRRTIARGPLVVERA